MSLRLPSGGRLIDRTRPLGFTFNGARHEGFAGDTLASALLGAGHLLLGRSFKYHRPRGLVASGAEEPNALVTLGTGRRSEPNTRTTTAELFEGATLASQNHWPSLGFDIGAVNGALSALLPAGFYYKTFMAPKTGWEVLFEPLIRRAAGLGRPPEEADADRYEQAYDFADVLVAGGGIAGLAAALAAGRAGRRVLVLEQADHWGGRAPVEGEVIDGIPAADWVRNALQSLGGMENVTLRRRTVTAGVFDHGHVIAEERIATTTPGDGRPRLRLWRIRTGEIIAATGAIERPLAFPGNDVPGVMLASAVRDYLVNWAVAPGRRIVVVTNNDDAYRTALALLDAGLEVPAVLDARPRAEGALPAAVRARGVPVLEGRGIGAVRGTARVTAVGACRMEGDGAALTTIRCDAVAMSGGWSPAVHLWSHCGGKLLWDEAQALFRPDPARPPLTADGSPLVRPAGAANGHLTADLALGDAHTAGSRAGGMPGDAAAEAAEGAPAPAPRAEATAEAPILPVWLMPAQAGAALKSKIFLDYQNDVKLSDVELAAREGYRSVEHAKRYTTLGMATDQGKLSNINGLAAISQVLHEPVPAVGTTTFRPPYVPLSLGAIAGEARGGIFQPLRLTPIDGWHDAHGADWEPVGLWRRPFAYPRPGETVAAAVNREVANTRTNVGLLDASTLGKILVKGPDAGRFLDMIYTGMLSTLPVGRCRYGLICNENGFLIDDGVAVRLGPDAWLCHTTTGGAERIHGHMEDWLQCEWWDWKVHTLNLTEQYAQIAVVGPKARALLERLGGIELSPEALPFMGFAEGRLGGIPARIFRISFSGELSFEVAVPAGEGLALWEALLAAGEDLGVAPYGTEALHVMRAEKGFIMIGDETDGTVIPQDLGLGWAISKKKPDYIGKRAQARSHMTRPDRWRLVGLETLDGAVLPDGLYAPEEGHDAYGHRNMQGRVTSTYFSPALGRGIALGLVRNGPERMGEVLDFPDGPAGRERVFRARIVSPVFFDAEGEKQNG